MGKQKEKQEYNVLLLWALIHNARDASSALAVQWNHINKYRHITLRGDNEIEKKKKDGKNNRNENPRNILYDQPYIIILNLCHIEICNTDIR